MGAARRDGSVRLTRWRASTATAFVFASALGLGAVTSPTAAGAAATSAPYRCTTTTTTLQFPVAIAGSTRKSVAPGAKVVLSGLQASITIPAVAVNLISLTGGRSASGKVTAVDIRATDATPATVNAAAAPIAFGPYTLVKGRPLLIKFPAAPISVGGWVARAKGTMTFTASMVVLTINIGTLPIVASCVPTAPDPITSVTVS